MAANLIETLSQVKDFRYARGQRYPLWLVLLLVISTSLIRSFRPQPSRFHLRCFALPKKTVELIVESGNDYVIAVKANQPKLYKQIQILTQMSTPSSIASSCERSRDRFTERTISVFEDLSGISPDWSGIKRLIKVERLGTRAGQPYHQVVYYISSLTLTAREFAHGIRSHWGIENRLHWVKDVVLQEDRSRIRSGYAPANLSITRTIAINLVRRHGYTSLTSAIRLLAHDLDAIFLLMEQHLGL